MQLSETVDLGWETLYKCLAFENHHITQIYPKNFQQGLNYPKKVQITHGLGTTELT